MQITPFFKAAAALALAFVAQAVSAQQAKPFTGCWYSDQYYLEMDFYDKDIPDPDTGGESTCAGVISLAQKYGGGTNTITSISVNGNKATGKAYFADHEAGVSFERKSNLTIRMICPGIEKGKGGKQVAYTKPAIFTLRPAWPFNGQWKLRGGKGKLNINLYNAAYDASEDEHEMNLCYGVIEMEDEAGKAPHKCAVIKRKLFGCEAEITFTDGRDGQNYCATLFYNPKGGTVSLKEYHREGSMRSVSTGICTSADCLVFE